MNLFPFLVKGLDFIKGLASQTNDDLAWLMFPSG